MWGSTTPNTADECNWAKAPFNGGASSYNETYFNQVKDTVCPNGVLAKEYDAASHIMGGDWKMPTQTDFQELIDYTTNEWVYKFNNSSVNGWKFTSKTDTSKYIFIPAAGDCYLGLVYEADYYGSVWSSSLDASDPQYAWYLDFGSTDGYFIHMANGGNGRCTGRSVRGVRK